MNDRENEGRAVGKWENTARPVIRRAGADSTWGRERTRPQALVYAKREASASAERHILQILRQRTRPDCLSSFFGAAAAAVGRFPLLAVLIYIADEHPAL